MPRTLSLAAARAAQAAQTTDAFLVLLTISHPELGTPLRVVSNNAPIVSRGMTFQPYFFDLVLATDDGATAAEVEITLDNVDLALIDMLREADTPPTFKIEVAMASTPSTVEMTVDQLKLREVTWDVSTIRGKLALEDVMNQAFPSAYPFYDPAQFAGLFP